MTQTNNPFFDEIGRLMNDAAGAAQGVKREVDTVMRTRPNASCATSTSSSARSSTPSRTWPAWRARRTRPQGPIRGAGSEARHFAGGAGCRQHEDGRVGDFITNRHGRVHPRPSTLFVAAARTWMPGPKAGHDGFGVVIGPKTAKSHFISLSFRSFGAKSPPRPQPPHPWRLAVGRQRAAMRPLTF